MADPVTMRQLEVRAPEPRSRSYDAIVIGSGMSGLTSAVILAREGMRVLVLEQHYRIGGYLHRFFRKGGVGFDVGFHYVGGVEPGQVLDRYLTYCGVRDRLTLIPYDQDGFDELRFPERHLRVPAGYEPYRDRLTEAFPEERAGIEEYCRCLPQIVERFGFYRLRAEQDLTHAERWMSQSLRGFVSGLTANPLLTAVLCSQSPLYGVEPRRTPMALHALVTDTYMQNAYTFKGGGDRLAQLMGEHLQELGGELQTRSAVTAILVDEHRRVQGVRTARGEEHFAPLVVSSANPKITLSLLPDDVLGPSYRRRVTGMQDGISTFSVYVTTDQDLSHYRGRNIYCYQTTNIDELYADRQTRNACPCVFVTVPSAREGASGDGRHQVVGFGLTRWDRFAEWADTRTGERTAAYDELKARVESEMLARIVETIPELAGHIRSVESATPLTNRDYMMSPGGAAYGLHHSIEQSGRLGLKPRTRLAGLYLTGQSVLFPGVVGATISAFHTCAGVVGARYLMGKVSDGI